MSWTQLTLRLNADNVERADALLRLAGAASISLHDDSDHPLHEPLPRTAPMWPHIRLAALFDGRPELDRLIKLLATEFPSSSPVAAEIRDTDWMDGWRQAVAPIEIGTRLRIAPDGDAPDHGCDARIMLRMGLAFGTGQHATTRLCLEWLASNVLPGVTVLDFGCGSGILALAALRLGAGFAYATDYEPQALLATTGNAELNGLDDSIWVGPPQTLPSAPVDLLLANILAGTLCELAEDFAGRQPAGATLVLSGILDHQVDNVLATYCAAYGHFDVAYRSGWCRIAATRKA